FDTVERVTLVPGPLFSERALTLGKGQLNFSVGYSFIDFSELNGTDLDNLKSPGLLGGLVEESRVLLDTVPEGVTKHADETLYKYPVTSFLLRTRVDLQAHIAVPTLRYGIAKDWDVSLAIPVVNTFLRVRNERVPVLDVDFSKASFVAAIDALGHRRDLGF